ncbi:zinc finger C3H1 domain-containing protein-like isoform X3 [Sander lucioperca]|uniref:zinc finger C3H1 domain-containing protein-like isoform X3 n=1 Tax=Sander lucioperca TaxID=283035 RepID=UPI0016538631|nr:zinc finger C3H1 domain-containing protein-like isoform X3 [Sander lucioperca]
MDLNTESRSPREERELEDGEICDDETEESVPLRRGDGNGSRPARGRGRGRGASQRSRKPHQRPHNMLPHMGHPPPDFRHLMPPYNRGPHAHEPFPLSHRQQCGPSGPERPPAASNAPLPLLGPHGAPNPRTSFWERSHGALGRFRHRAMPNGGRGGWSRGGRGGGNSRGPPGGRYGPAESHGNTKDSPSRKQKQAGRNPGRKPAHSVSKPDNSVDESFEDLLSKYKQIQLELECIRKEETLALEPKGDQKPDPPASVTDPRPDPEPQDSALAQTQGPAQSPAQSPGLAQTLSPAQAQAQSPAQGPGLAQTQGPGLAAAAAAEEAAQLEEKEKKVFQAFNIKPLRLKLPRPASLDQLRTKGGEDQKGAADRDGEEEEEEVAAEAEAEAEEELEEKKKKTACVCCGGEEADGEEKAKRCLCRRESSASSEDSVLSPDKPVVKVEEEELSELQLRLLALQSASKKWQQKEQQVMKKSKDRITKVVQEKKSAGPAATPTTPPGRQRVTTRSASAAAAASAAADRSRTRSRALDKDRDRSKAGPRAADRDRDRPKASPKPGPKAPPERRSAAGKTHAAKKMISPGSAAKQAFRKQQLRTWKLQQQREQEEKRRQEEEERRKREDEIRRIRDLSNQDEQYNRFMKLVGGKARTRSKSRDREHRKSAGKQGLDASGNLYQYDNYDEVAMDTDSETGSPVASPPHSSQPPDDPAVFPRLALYAADCPPLGLDLCQPFLPPLLHPPPPPLPPPPDEAEPPPKPPFADEEEEEEMLLRETCLMSMANKRVAAPEDQISSSPASPSCPPAAAVQQPIRGNLSSVSLNAVAPSRSNKFSRGHHAARAPLVLPRHKSVVVSLNDSEDSESDGDASSSTPPAFGGLEFMIKEARRTVEAAKPKAASASEKENNPVRTPEALPEAKRAEYRLLKEEIASREKQKMLKDPHSSVSTAVSDSPLDSAAKAAAELKLTEAEQRVLRHRELLQRDEAVLRHLLQQELKKRESLKAAEAKVSKLREQLAASEKIVSANRTLLKKLQEQVQRVEHRVSIKKSLAVRLEQELSQLAACRGPKRKNQSSIALPVRKLQRVDERHFSELMSQKQRLQQLESEYALKIQKLKEAQALHNRAGAAVAAEPAVRASPPLPPAAAEPQSQAPPPSPSFPLPQPSLHDLTQDKLTLDSEDVPEGEDSEPTPAAVKGTRRNSLRQSSCSFTKPHLEQLGATPAKDAKPPNIPISKAANIPVSQTASAAGGGPEPAEVFAGLDVDALKQRYQQQARLGELLQSELHTVGEPLHATAATGTAVSVEVDTATSQSGTSDLRPVPFGSYHSPLLVFRSYRFSPYYRTKEKLSLSSVTHSNTIEPRKCFCRFDLTGTCNDDDCRWQHMRNCTLTGNQLFQDILSYNLSLIGCSESSSYDDVSVCTEKYMKKLFGSNKDRMGVDQKAVLLVSKVNESKRHVPPFTTWKDPRRWRPKPSVPSGVRPEDDSEDESAEQLTAGRHDGVSRTSLSALDVCVTSEDKRYFISETDDISNLETSVLESPRDTQLWIKLAFKYLNQNETSAAECLEAALNTLSRALESNCDNPEVWSHYLSLFSRRGSREEVQEMCEMAVEHAPDYQVWWNYLKLESSFEGKDYVCERLLHFLLSEASSGVSDKLSFQLMEALLYRVHLNLFTGRMDSALALLQNALKSAQERSVADHLTASDRALLWLSYIHLTEFERLPCSLHDPAESGPSRLVSRETFLLPWRTPQDVRTPPDILIALFQDGVRQCSDESASASERTLACLPLHTNLIFLNTLLDRFDEGVSLCESLLQFCPESCTLRDALAELHIRRGETDQAVSMWLHALAECPNNAEVFYHSAKFLMAQDKSSAITPLFRGFILSLCDDQQSQKKPVDVLRHMLGFPTEDLLRRPISRELQETLSQQTPYLHLIHCRWQWLHGSVEDAVDAFERALGSAMQRDELHKLWMDYLVFSSSQSKLFSDLVQRCLSTVPSRLEVPFNPAEFWSCYSFHNKVVTLYLSCLPQSQHALVLERLRYAMPNNIELGLRLLHQEWQDGNIEHLKFQVRMLSSHAPRCLANWKIAIAVERELNDLSEVRLLYQQALHNLPLCAALWKHRLLFEAAEGSSGSSDRLRRLLDRCQQVGVSLSDQLVDRCQQVDRCPPQADTVSLSLQTEDQ